MRKKLTHALTYALNCAMCAVFLILGFVTLLILVGPWLLAAQFVESEIENRPKPKEAA